MRFESTPIPGAWVIEVQRHTDERGWFTRTWCRREFADHGLPADFPQGNLSFNSRRGTLRGMHFQKSPSMEGKLVRCGSGSVFDVIIDLRPHSPAFMGHFGVVLSAENGHSLFVPPGCAHGFETLEDNSEVVYAMTDFHAPALGGGVRWNDPAFGIAWPIDRPAVMSDRDREYPDCAPTQFEMFRGYRIQ